MTEQNKETNKENTNNQEQLKEFDLDGVKLYAKNEDEFNKAKTKLDTMRTGYKEVLTAKEKAAQEKADAERKLELKTLAEKGLWEDAEKKISEKYINEIKTKDESLAKLSGKVIDGELKGLLASNPELLPEAINDALKLLKADHKFDFDGETLKANGKPAKEVISDFLKDKNYWKKANLPAGTGAGRKVATGISITNGPANEKKIKQQAFDEAMRQKLEQGLGKKD
jgi:hypothetical protein